MTKKSEGLLPPLPSAPRKPLLQRLRMARGNTWLVVALSLPIASQRNLARSLRLCWPSLKTALREGKPDPSPNAGFSQAAYAHGAQVQLGGSNSYGGQIQAKPILGAGLMAPDPAVIGELLRLSRKLEQIWVGAAACPLGLAALVPFITKILS